MHAQMTEDEKAISSWLKNHQDHFLYLNINKSCVNVQQDKSIWSNKRIPQSINHASVEFLSNPALVMNYNYISEIPKENNAIDKIPDQCLNFNSAPGEPIDSELAKKIASSEPSSLILPINNFSTIMDSRTPTASDMPGENIVQHPEVPYYTFEFKSIEAEFDLITPIILSLYVFDANIGRRVSEQWTFVPEQWKQALGKDPEFNNIINSPKKVSLPLEKPRVLKSQDVTEQLFLVLVLDRSFILKGGAAVDDYYINQKDANKKKALLSTKEGCSGGWSNTFAYGAIPISTIMNTISTGVVTFDHVVATQQADEEYLQHKLNKIRKNPINYAIKICFNIQKQDPKDNSIPRIAELYPLKPFFNLQYEEKLLIKLKTVVLNLKVGMKGRNIAAIISCSDGNNPLNIINGKSTFKTRCQYHCTQPMFQEDIILDLPFPVKPSMNISFKFYHLPSKKKKGDIKFCAEGTFPLMIKETGLMRTDGEYKIPLKVDPKIQDAKDNSKSFAVVDLEMHSFLHSSHPFINEFLSGNFTNFSSVQKIDEIVDFFPPIMDSIFKNISTNQHNSFEILLSVLRLIPIEVYDTRFSTMNSSQDEIYTPDRLLSFYAKYAALRNVNIDQFFNAFVPSWVVLTHGQTSYDRQDFVSCQFLLEILVKCIYLKHEFIYSTVLQELIINLQKGIFQIGRTDAEHQSYGIRLSHFLTLFYKDLIEFNDRGRIFFFIHHHLASLTEIRTNKFDQCVFADFMSTFFTPKSFLYSLIPTRNDDPRSCFFMRDIAILIEEGLATPNHTMQIFSVLFEMMIHISYSDLEYLTPSLECLITLFGRNIEVLGKNKQTDFILIPLLVILQLIGKSGMNKLTKEFDQSFIFILKTSNQHVLKRETKEYSIVRKPEKYGYNNSFAIEEISTESAAANPEQKSNNIHFTSQFVWKRLAFMIQLILVNYTTSSNSIHVLNDMMIPFLDIQMSSSLFATAKTSLLNYIRTNSTLIFTSPNSRIYKLIEYVMKYPTHHNTELIDELWNVEKEIFNTNNRCKAFTLRAMRKYKINESHLPNFEKSLIKPLLQEYLNLEKNFSAFDIEDPNNHETLADLYRDISEFFRPSPDTRVEILLELANYHMKFGYFSEATTAQLTAGAIVAEYLKILGRIPDVFKDNVHPANSFKVACPTADLEICPPSIMNDLPNIPGFCTSNYFSQCGMIYLIHLPMEVCKRSHMHELSTRVHSLLRPLAETNHLWKVLEKHYQNGAFSWNVLQNVKTKGEREFGNYYRVEFQDNGTYIYRETSYANLWQVSEKLKEKAKIYANSKPIVVLNDGEGLSTAKIEPDKYYVHVKAVEQYFTNEEKLERITPFEQNYNVLKFYFDIPFSKSGQQSIEFLELKRTIYTVTYPVPYIVSRVKVPPENIKKIIFSPIEFSCESLQKQVDKINDATNNGDFMALQPLIQGSLLTQVNEGPKKMAEVFLTGATENEHTLMLRTIFRKFLKANEVAVKLHGEWVTKNPDFMILQEELELGLNKLTSTLQPFLK